MEETKKFLNAFNIANIIVYNILILLYILIYILCEH